jgi:hypothetical protein
VLRVGGDELDLHRFERFVRGANDALGGGEVESALALLEQALALWRGPALEDLPPGAFADSERQRLAELRLAALEDRRIDAELALGRHARAAGDLEALVARHPLRERLRAQLMLAHYRCGRQAEALAGYKQARRALVDELGIEPSPQLQRLERAILTHDPALDPPNRTRHLQAVPVAPPAATGIELLGRDEDLAAIRAFLDGAAPAALLLDGEAGIGKTSLWRAGIAAADGHGVLVARPTRAETQLPFAALADLLADVLDEVLPVIPTPQRLGLEAALLLADTDGKPPDQRTVAAALLSVLRELASHRPLLVAIDDVQWLDPASRSALVFCVRRLRDQPVRLLLTARVARDDDQDAEVALAIGEDRLQRLTLGRPRTGNVRSLLQTTLETNSQRPALRRL